MSSRVLAAAVAAGAVAVVGWPLGGILARTALSPRQRARPGTGAVVVLGSTLQDGAVPPVLASRLQRAAAVYREAAAAGRPPLVVASGGGDGATSEASAMAAALVGLGVPVERLVLEEVSTTTRENLAESAALLARRAGAPRAVVVTSDFHVWRTAALARRAGLRAQVLGAPTPARSLPRALLRESALVLGSQRWSVAAAGAPLAATAAHAAVCAAVRRPPGGRRPPRA
ncbi:YdcF family protein [Quadrisphaera sp. DSM 44207]|uniref:YdcF family protein n=1 Tax=Quadrisphaera sp. DSM 44207 TaxID=1881057 RepID=UPI00088BEF3B|nr:YdcF family protein [Quadrisphaera sp. DSM 44207]SDQ05950.1 DUF218 domain-containing protein [Quadrisphaera sp. DSM 44207]